MIKWIKRLFSVEQHVEPTTVVATAPEPLVLKEPIEAKLKAVAKPKKETKTSLDALTKAQIETLAKEKFNVDLDRRKTKEAMIKEFIKEQKAK